MKDKLIWSGQFKKSLQIKNYHYYYKIFLNSFLISYISIVTIYNFYLNSISFKKVYKLRIIIPVKYF